MKFCTNTSCWLMPHIKKFLLVMKLATFLILLSMMQVSASSFAQKITLSKRSVTLEQLFNEITKQTGYSVFYADSKLDQNHKVTVDFRNTPLEDVLEQSFENLELSYSIKDRNILVKKKEASFLERVIERFQRIDVRGRVVDEKNQPLSGATINVKNSGQGAKTDAQGNFFLSGIEEKSTLVISYVGFKTREITAKSDLGVLVLELHDNSLEQVQVIAYGEIQKKFTTGNVAGIKAKDIQNQPVGNLQLALAGRVPGLQIQQRTGLSSSTVDITVQGVNSLSNGSQPFYVIDGIPYSPEFGTNTLMGESIAGRGGNAFDFINPADIESITILKDADATAIYGSRAANGAILITTRKGKAGKTQVDVNFRNGWGRPTRFLNMLNTQQYLEMRRDAYANAGQTVPTTESNPTTSNFDVTSWDQTRTTDWQKELVGENATFTNLQASLSGGNENTQFLAGYGYIRESTPYYKSPSNSKGNVHFNLNHKSTNQRFTYVLSATYLQGRNNLYNLDLMKRATLLAPNAPDLYNPDGSINFYPAPKNPAISSFRVNPAAAIETPFQGNTTNLLANNTLGYEIIKGLNIKTSVGYNRLATDETVLFPIRLTLPEAPVKLGSASFLTKSIKSWIIEPQITYQKSFKAGVLDVLIGGTIQETNTSVLGQSGYGYANDAQLKNLAAAPEVVIQTVVASQYQYNALFGRLNYRLLDKYIVNITARRDGSSRFGDDNKLHNFYSIGGAWLFGAENLIKENLVWLSSGKLRLNYGTTGNDQISDYRYLSLFDNLGVDVPYMGAVGTFPTNIANPKLQWEETRKLNLGLDLGILRDKMLISVNYFRNRSSNQLLSSDLPSVAGFTGIDLNIPATVQNSGVELQIGAEAINQGSFHWRTSANVTIPRNRLVSFPGIENTAYAEQYIVGKSIATSRLYKYSGVNTETGLYEFYNSKGEKTSYPDGLTDRTEVIDRFQKFYGGWSNTFDFKGFSLDFLFQFVKQIGENYRFGTLPGVFNANQPAFVANRWRKPGDIAEIQKASLDFGVRSIVGTAMNSDANYRDASYIRLKNVSLSYSIPQQWLSKAHISTARIFFQGQNLLTITRYVGTDPETQVVGALPPLRMLTFGLQLTL